MKGVVSIAVLVVALPLAAAQADGPIVRAADRDCSDFDNQRQAQRYF